MWTSRGPCEVLGQKTPELTMCSAHLYVKLWSRCMKPSSPFYCQLIADVKSNHIVSRTLRQWANQHSTNVNSWSKMAWAILVSIYNFSIMWTESRLVVILLIVEQHWGLDIPHYVWWNSIMANEISVRYFMYWVSSVGCWWPHSQTLTFPKWPSKNAKGSRERGYIICMRE